MKPVISLAENNRLSFWCLGCNETHVISYGTPGNSWTWNNDFVKPTFTPSVHVKSGHHCTQFKAGIDNCWCTYYEEFPNDEKEFKCISCHSFVTDGMIVYLPDSTHSLAGKTVALPEWPKNQP